MAVTCEGVTLPGGRGRDRRARAVFRKIQAFDGRRAGRPDPDKVACCAFMHDVHVCGVVSGATAGGDGRAAAPAGGRGKPAGRKW